MFTGSYSVDGGISVPFSWILFVLLVFGNAG